jgi:transposase
VLYSYYEGEAQMEQQKYTIHNFNYQFPDDNACLDWIVKHLYPEGVYCPFCERITKHHRDSNRRSYSCDRCGHHLHPCKGTIFEKSTTSLRDWFYAMFIMSSTRCGVSAKQLQRELGVTYKTAWRMFKEIRKLFNDNPSKMFGEFELDETYVGGKHSGSRGRAAKGKTPVFGIAQRKGNVKAQTTDDVKRSTIYPIVQKHIEKDSTIYTDEYVTYDKIKVLGYKHERVNHESKVFVIGNAHTNTIEGFWSLLKRGIGGVYHSVSPKYLQNYVNEYAFRYNHRKDEKPMFLSVLEKV